MKIVVHPTFIRNNWHHLEAHVDLTVDEFIAKAEDEGVTVSGYEIFVADEIYRPEEE